MRGHQRHSPPKDAQGKGLTHGAVCPGSQSHEWGLSRVSREKIGRASQASLKMAMALKMTRAYACFQISTIS